MSRSSFRGALAASLLLAATAGAQGPLEPDLARGVGVVALKAGEIHLVDGGRVVTDGTILVRDGKILAVGDDIAVPPHACIVDYGADAVIVPGLVSAYSSYALGSASPRTASPGTRAIDSFDPYRELVQTVRGGVTSAYITPSESRLIAGVGALVKVAGDDPAKRVLNAEASIHGAIDEAARNTSGYWEPPVPATVDGGPLTSVRQLPKTTMGAIVGLNELVGAARGGADVSDLYGTETIEDLRALLDAGVTWRLSAVEEHEISALLDFAAQNEVQLVIDKALHAADLADEIAAGGHTVVFRVPYQPNGRSRDYGKDENAAWPRFDVPAALNRAGVRFAIAGSSPADLLFLAGIATRGGLDPAAALRAITLTPAEICGASDRVGSIRPGKDADFCVLNSAPFTGYASVLATWIDGCQAWSPTAISSRATVVEVDELHLGDGEVLRPGQVLLSEGRIVEVGPRVSHPVGAQVVRGHAAMPGIIDAFGHLGLEGSSKVPSTDFQLRSLLAPADEVDRRVAKRGITTVVMAPRGPSGSGAPIMAYKPAGSDPEHQLVGDPVALRVTWKSGNRLASGKGVRGLLAKGAEYRQKWLDYEKAMSEWTPPAPEPPKDDDEDDEEEEDDDEKESDEDDDKKKKKKKKKGEEELEPDPITGAWAAELEDGSLKMRLHFEAGTGSGDVVGNLRCAAVSETLVEVEGRWNRDDNQLELMGLGSSAWIRVEAKVEEQKLVGKAMAGSTELEFTAERTSKEYVVAGRSERRKEEAEKAKPPKGMPKKPRIDSKLEPLKRAIEGEVAIVVDVDREDEILECVEAFESYGIHPVLYGAQDAHLVADQIVGRVRGILLPPRVRAYEAKKGAEFRTPYGEIQNAGIPIAFYSGAEEGAIDLPLRAAYAVANGMSPGGALRALTSDAAAMMAIDHRVGRLESGLDGDLLLLDGPPLAPGTSVVRTWVNGEEVSQ